LGEGGMGQVFEATNGWTERRVALKVMHAQVAQDEQMIERFFREARVASRIGHPNIIDVLDMGHDAETGVYYIVQEFLDGVSLRSHLDRSGQLSAREAFELLIPVMSALVAAHRAGVVHRDLKPDNIFLQRAAGGFVPKLIDFGIAKVASPEADSNNLTRTGSVMGTPSYMSPEQARGEKNVGPGTDVWAMGVVWFEALSGRCPFEGENYNELLSKILIDPAPPLRSLVANQPSGLLDVVDRTLTKDRSVRLASMQDFLSALLTNEAIAHEPWIVPLRSLVASRAQQVSPSLSDTTPALAAPTPLVAPNTLSVGATELRAPPDKKSFVSRALVATMGAVALVATIGVGVARFAATPRPAAVVQRPSDTTRVVTAQRRERYVVRVSAVPSTAQLVLDGEPLGASSMAREFEKNGQRHELRVTADGFQPQVVSFVDVPPQESIALVAVQPLSTGASRSQTVAGSNSARPVARPNTASTAAVRPIVPVVAHEATNTASTSTAIAPERPRATNGAQIVEP
jgi:serine/threonine protein kinase